MSQVFCLSMHAPYRCEHSGACCTAGWDIPAEAPVVSAVELHFGPAFASRLTRAGASSAETAAILPKGPDGACAFFDAAGGRLCTIHRDLGEPLLPSACRQFPRVTLVDPRGTWITLSHFCPTAASLLFVPAPLRIVAAPDPISLAGGAEGLDARDALPPLLRPGMLMDFDGYAAWETCAVKVLDSAESDAGTALSALDAITREIREWSPGSESLRDVVARAMRSGPQPPVPADLEEDIRRHALAVASVPRGLEYASGDEHRALHHPGLAYLWREFDAVIRRYLAAKLFASWWPYLGLDLVAVVSAIRVHAAVLRISLGRRLLRGETGARAMREAIRDTDLLMVHLSDSRALARLIAQS